MSMEFASKTQKKSDLTFRPLSNSLVQKLKAFDKKEQEGNEETHFLMGKMYYALAPLYKRGLIQVREKTVNNKLLHCVFLTKEGKEYLENLKK